MSSKPIIAVTMGDPAGIGPEIILKALGDPMIGKVARPLILGDWGVLQRTHGGKKKYPKLICWQQGRPLLPMLNHPSAFVVCPLSSLAPRESRHGISSRAGGHGAFRYIRVAAKLALSKVADAVATAPISKSILIDAGYNYPGHTELLAELSRTPECRMMLIGGKLRVVPVTGHIAFTKVARSLTSEGIQTTLELTHRSLRYFFGIMRPRIAVAALNPHAGEQGIFGLEEIDVIGPAVKVAQRKGLAAFGPLPADSLFHQAARGDYDAVVCMYHDQGLIPLKLHHFFGGVALTLGLPFIRTSVDHGTAYDIAGTGKADETSMKEAILLAARLARRLTVWRKP
jgi:4-phospho-D-threonate 3-dehydrogenase / 4-phospho-D-erythronate 3-dehydrogenase